MPPLRITGGALRGRRVPVPAADVRPTSERARQAYFNIVHDRIDGARFLDLFAGSGIFSFEALSRGAAVAIAVEQNRKQCTAIEGTARTLGVAVTVLSGDVLGVLPRVGTTALDLVYADPPYDYGRYDDLLTAIAHAPLADEALVAVEHRRRSTPFHDMPLREIRRNEYGEVWITFFQR